MSIIDSCTQFPIDDFGGGNQRGERSDVKPEWAIEATNCEFEPGFLKTRKGVYPHPSSVFTEAGPVSGVYNHLYANKSYVYRAIQTPGTNVQVARAQYDGTGATAGAPTLNTATPGYGTFAGFGKRVYCVLGNAAQDSGLLGAIDTTTLLQQAVWIPPLEGTEYTMAFVITPAVGQVTAGTHAFFLLVRSKTGFVTRTSPITTLSSGNPTPFATAGLSANDSITFTLTPVSTWSPDIYSIQLVATPINLVDRYIVVGTENVITSPTMNVVLTFDINDVDLTQLTQTNDTYDQVIYTGLNQAVSTDQPVKPYYCFQCGERLGIFYIDPFNGPTMGFSEPSNYEWFQFNRHMIQLPGAAKAIAGKWAQGTIYIYTENGTYAYVDTGGFPVTWPKPRVVDAKIGVSVPYAITLDSGGNGFVAHRTGLYAFEGGQYLQVPLSYWQPDSWDVIDWANPSISLTDDKEKYRAVFCYKDLSGTRHVLTWNYTNGFGPNDVKFSEYFYQSTVINWVTDVMNYGDAQSSKYRQQLWLQSNTVGRWLLDRFPNDATPYRDTDQTGGGPVARAVYPQKYRLAYLPPRPKPNQMQVHHFGLMRIIGNGNYVYKAYSLDDAITVTVSDVNGSPQVLTLSNSPGKETLVGYSLVSESASPELSLNDTNLDSFFEISHWGHFYKPWSMRRGS